MRRGECAPRLYLAGREACLCRLDLSPMVPAPTGQSGSSSSGTSSSSSFCHADCSSDIGILLDARGGRPEDEETVWWRLTAVAPMGDIGWMDIVVNG